MLAPTYLFLLLFLSTLAHRPPSYPLLILHPPSHSPYTILLLHPAGFSASSLLPLSNLLPTSILVLPQAYNLSLQSTSLPLWYSARPDADGVLVAASAPEHLDAANNISRLIWQLPQPIALVGISQGGSLALTTCLRYAVRACVVVSGSLELAERYPRELGEKAGGLLIVHGERDEVAPVERARTGSRMIREWERQVEYVEFEGEGHRLEGVQRELWRRVGLFLDREVRRYR